MIENDVHLTQQVIYDQLPLCKFHVDWVITTIGLYQLTM